MGTDGVWAAAYREARRNTSEKIEWLNRLSRGAGTDLGVLDAAALVHEVYKGSPLEVRDVAQEILLDRFENGSTVAVEMLNQYRGGTSQSELMTIEQLTGEVLPGGNSQGRAGVSAAARLALVEHALELRDSETDRQRAVVELLMEDLVDAYRARLGLVGGKSEEGAVVVSVEEVARRLQQGWRAAAVEEIGAGSDGSGESSAGALVDVHRRDLNRRRMVRGPIQDFVAGQLAILDLMAAVTVSRQPGLEEAVGMLLKEGLRERERITDGLSQGLAIEETMVALWRLRFRPSLVAAGKDRS